jgi:hypothetical protein
MICPCCRRDTLSRGPRAVIPPWEDWIQCLNPDCKAQNIWVSPDGKGFERLPGPTSTPPRAKA